MQILSFLKKSLPEFEWKQSELFDTVIRGTFYFKQHCQMCPKRSMFCTHEAIAKPFSFWIEWNNDECVWDSDWIEPQKNILKAAMMMMSSLNFI